MSGPTSNTVKRKPVKHLAVRPEDHKEFIRMAKKEGMTYYGLFAKVVKEMKRKELLAELG